MACIGCKGVRRMMRGAVGLAKAATGIDAAPADEVQCRRDICRQCPHASRNPAKRYAAAGGLTSMSRCGLCTCYIAAKTRLSSEVCPAGKW